MWVVWYLQMLFLIAKKHQIISIILYFTFVQLWMLKLKRLLKMSITKTEYKNIEIIINEIIILL